MGFDAGNISFLDIFNLGNDLGYGEYEVYWYCFTAGGETAGRDLTGRNAIVG